MKRAPAPQCGASCTAHSRARCPAGRDGVRHLGRRAGAGGAVADEAHLLVLVGHYATTFYVGSRGVLLFDPLEGHGAQILQAIAEVTKLPVTAVVYSHDHADHIADAAVIRDASAKVGVAKLRIIASKQTAEKMKALASKHPAPTETVAWPTGSFRFEGLTVALHGQLCSLNRDGPAAKRPRGVPPLFTLVAAAPAGGRGGTL